MFWLECREFEQSSLSASRLALRASEIYKAFLARSAKMEVSVQACVSCAALRFFLRWFAISLRYSYGTMAVARVSHLRIFVHGPMEVDVLPC